MNNKMETIKGVDRDFLYNLLAKEYIRLKNEMQDCEYIEKKYDYSRIEICEKLRDILK